MLHERFQAVDKAQLARRFGAAARHYDAHARFQQEVGLALLERQLRFKAVSAGQIAGGDFERIKTYENQLDHFIAVIERKVAPLISARDGMKTLAATLAVERASIEDRAISLTEMLKDAGAA